jgi:hypothetical protein
MGQNMMVIISNNPKESNLKQKGRKKNMFTNSRMQEKVAMEGFIG